MIELKGLNKEYFSGEKKIVALEDVSLRIEEGTIFGIIGLSGAGKSTLIRCINLLERPTTGEVFIDGENLFPSQLSGGQKQRVAIARALATNPKYLLCDEATSALDPKTTASILKLLKDLNASLGVTVIIITHEMKVVESICKEVAVIDGGRVVETGKVKDVFENPASEALKELLCPHINVEEEEEK